jgi:hypothetical protein
MHQKPNPPPTLTLDVEYYQKYLDDSDLTEAQKTELLETLWAIICEFVMMGFNVHPVQQAQQSSGKDDLAGLPPIHGVLSALESDEGQ